MDWDVDQTNDLNIAPRTVQQSWTVGEVLVDPTALDREDRSDRFDVFLAHAMRITEEAAETLPVGGQPGIIFLRLPWGRKVQSTSRWFGKGQRPVMRIPQPVRVSCLEDQPRATPKVTNVAECPLRIDEIIDHELEDLAMCQ